MAKDQNGCLSRVDHEMVKWELKELMSKFVKLMKKENHRPKI